ncbi:MAG: hypothetical protein Fur0020_11240 [Thermodesulfovibrionia bacterium]
MLERISNLKSQISNLQKIMKVVISIVILFIIFTSSISYADDSLQKAYSLYYKGRMQEAIRLMKDYVDKNPDPKVIYFIGYAYYKIRDMENARRYFKDAYLIDPHFSPVRR